MSEDEAKLLSEEETSDTPKKGRGRPKKVDTPASGEKRKAATPSKKEDGEPKAKRGRGRPPKKGGPAAKAKAKSPSKPAASSGTGRGRGRAKKSA